MNRLNLLILITSLIFGEGTANMAFNQNLEIRDISSRLELFVDDFLIDKLVNTTHKLHTPVRLATAPNAIEGSYVTIIQDGPIFRRYFRSVRDSYSGERFDGHPGEITCYLESRDGINWIKPDLKLFEVDGSWENNVILAEAPYCHNFSPFLDRKPGVPSEQRYKAFSGTHKGGGLMPWTSPDKAN